MIARAYGVLACDDGSIARSTQRMAPSIGSPVLDIQRLGREHCNLMCGALVQPLHCQRLERDLETMKHIYCTVRLGTKRLPTSRLVEKGRLHVAKVTNNPNFPDPPPCLAELAAAVEELDKVNQLADFSRGRQDIQLRNSGFARVCQLIRQLGGFVQSTSRGDQALIMDAGFDVKLKRQPSQPMAVPQKVVARRTLYPGRIEVRWGAVKNKMSYRVYMAAQGLGFEGKWQTVTVTSRNHFTMEDLPSDVIYSFRIEAWGALGAGPLSDMASAKAA